MKTTTNKINENLYTSPNCGTSTLIREESGDRITFEETLPGTQGPEMPYLDGSLWNIPGYPQTSSNMIGRCQNSKPSYCTFRLIIQCF